MVVVNYFSEVFGNATRTVVQNAALVKKIYLPREMFPVATTWVGMIHFFPQVLVLLVGSIVYGWRPTVTGLLAAVTGFALITVLALGLGLLFGAINVLFRDFENIVDLLLLVATWASPILYRWTDVQRVLGDGILLNIYLTNPVTVAVELFHFAFWFPIAESAPGSALAMPPAMGVHTALGCGIALAQLVLGQVVIRRLEGRFAQEL
jgi:ABC-2 type transport system permease protein